MNKSENQKKLLKILNEIFQLDRSDLDFGIYRIMNTKSKEINEFSDKDLLSSVASAFSKSENEAEQNELDELKTKDAVSGYINGDESTKKVFENLDDVKRYTLLNEKLSTTTTSSSLENDVFSHLANFFRRYSLKATFIPTLSCGL
jgi:adenine-specific DNA-methyltransferase